MADQSQPLVVAAAFPTPPPYHKYFTKDNLAKLKECQKEQQASSGSDEAAPISDDLRYLVPPEPPTDGKYKSFGVQHDLNQPDISLEAAGITQIYPYDRSSTDPTPKLLALTRAIILNFLELVGIMSNNPEEAPEKIEDLQTLFYNAHDLINQYRPHQARESLILMMEEQLEHSRNDIAAVKDGKMRVAELLKSMRDAGAAQEKIIQHSAPMTNGAENGAPDPEALKRRTAQQSQWDLLEAELG